MSTHAPRDCLGLPYLLRERATQTPDHVALVESKDITYAELWHRVLDLAQTYNALGMRPGDRIAMALENSGAYVIAYYAALAASCVPVGLNPRGKSGELSRCIVHSGARLFVTRAENPELEAVMTSCQDVALLLACGEGSSVIFRSGTSAITLQPQATNSLMLAATPVDSLAALVYTSGTTAQPKAVMLSHGNLRANIESIVQSLALNGDERCLVSLPLFCAYGASVLHTHLSIGATLVIEEHAVYAARLLARVAEQRATSMPLVPSMLPMLFRRGQVDRVDLSSLRRITFAGGACRASEVLRLRALLPHVDVFVMYGQTEATARLCCLPAKDLERCVASVGPAIPGVELEIRGDAGERLPVGKVGEVFARGPNVMLGYYKDPGATEAVLKDGWLRTGDVGCLDPNGFLYLQGRRTDIIKTGAHRVNPHEIEEVISELEGIEDSVVLGAPDDLLGEAVIAYIQRTSTNAVSAEDVQRHCRTRLSLHKLPRRVEFVSELPKTASGKALRRILPRAS